MIGTDMHMIGTDMHMIGTDNLSFHENHTVIHEKQFPWIYHVYSDILVKINSVLQTP